jgi:hypothetical protein
MKNITHLISALAFAALALSTGCEKLSSGPGADTLEGRIDKHGDEIMASSAKGEARDWMKQPSHISFEKDPKGLEKFVEDFYAAGATQVLIGDIEEHDGKQFAGSLLVVLPKDSAARAKIFEVGARANTAFQEDPVTDKGQKYLYYSFD